MGKLVVGEIVRLYDGTFGRVRYVNGNWVGVFDGRRVDEWQRHQIIRC